MISVTYLELGLGLGQGLEVRVLNVNTECKYIFSDNDKHNTAYIKTTNSIIKCTRQSTVGFVFMPPPPTVGGEMHHVEWICRLTSVRPLSDRPCVRCSSVRSGGCLRNLAQLFTTRVGIAEKVVKVRGQRSFKVKVIARTSALFRLGMAVDLRRSDRCPCGVGIQIDVVVSMFCYNTGRSVQGT